MPRPGAPADMREPQKSERLWLAKTPRLTFAGGEPPEFDQAGFSAFSSKLNCASLSRSAAQNRSASSRCSKPITR